MAAAKKVTPSRDDCVEMNRSCASFNLRRAARAVTRHYDAYLKQADLTATQLPILAAIATTEPYSVRELADILDLERSTLSRDLAVLQRKGFVATEQAADRRASVIRLTRAGRRKLDQAYALWTEAHDALSISSTKFDEAVKSVKRLGIAANALAPASTTRRR